MRWIFSLFASLYMSLPSISDALPLGEQCSSLSRSGLRRCVDFEARKIPTGNLPNEYLIMPSTNGLSTILDIMSIFEGRTDSTARSIVSKKPDVMSADKFALIVQYLDEPRFYYYSISRQGRLAPVFEDLNSMLFPTEFPAFGPDPTRLYFKSDDASSNLTEWIAFIYKAPGEANSTPETEVPF